MNKDILLKDDKNNNLFPLAHKDSDQNIIKDTYAPLNMPSFTGGVGIGTSAESDLVKSNMPIQVESNGTLQGAIYTNGDTYTRQDSIVDRYSIANKGFLSYRADYSGDNTASGCVRFATITIKYTNTNGPLTILIAPRGMSPTLLTVRFNNSGVDPVLDDCMTRGGNVTCGIRKTATSTWDLYCQNGGTYQNILFQVVTPTMLYQGATLEWNNTVSTSWPSDIIYATRGVITPMGTGNVDTANGSLNGQLVIKSASVNTDGTPNNGVVFEFGNSTNWRGQLYLGDNADQGVYVNGWNNGVRGTWKKLMFQNDLASLLEPIRVSNTSSNIGVGIGVDPQNNKVISNKEIDVVDSSSTVQSAMYPSGNIYAKSNITADNNVYGRNVIEAGTTSSTTEHRVTALSSGGQMQLYSNSSTKGIYARNASNTQGYTVMRVQDDGRVWLYGADNVDNSHRLMGHNGTNLWIGGQGTSYASVVGKVCICAGYDSDSGTGNKSIMVNVANAGNTAGTTYWVYHENYFPPMSNTLSTSGIAVYQSRCTIYSGGYHIAHKMVFFHMELQIKTSLGTNDYWTLLTGLPKPQSRDATLSVSGYQLKGVFNAYVSTAGELIVNTGSLALANGNYLLIGGFYFIA